MQIGPVIVDEVTAHHEAPGVGVLNVTSYRTGASDPSRRRLVSSFLSVSWVIDEASGGDEEPDERAMPPTPSPSGWQPIVILVEGEERPFEQMTAGGHWLALGSIDGHRVSIEAHGVPAELPALSRIRDLAAWVRSPAAAAGNRPIVELGDRLGDLFGLP